MLPVEYPVSMEDFTDPLVPLIDAAHFAYFKVNGQQTDHAGILNRIARLIAENTRVFSRAHGEDDWHLVMPADVAEGALQQGGAYLEFRDARASRGNLAVMRRELPVLLNSLKKRLAAFKQT
jgi:hypothetical protein